MLESVKERISELIALYESEKQRADSLESKLEASERDLKACQEQITELNHQMDNMKLTMAFSSEGDNTQAKKSIEKLIHEIDKCITRLEN